MKMYCYSDGTGTWFKGLSPTGRPMMVPRFTDGALFTENELNDMTSEDRALFASHNLRLYSVDITMPVRVDGEGSVKKMSFD